MLRQVGLVSLSLLSFSSALVTNDFESGWDQTTWPSYAPDCSQGGTVSLDSTVAHSGKNSMKVAGAGGYCGHAFFGTTQVPSGDVYVRTWVQTSKALTDDHVTFIVMPDTTEGAGKHLRLGAMSKVMIYNRQSDDATLPDLSPQGIATSANLPSGSWQCLEYHLGTDGTIETWLNGAAVPGMTVGPGISNANANGWTRGSYVPKITGVYFGWESYGSAANTFWYDDIAIGSSRIGCSGSTQGPTTTTPVATTRPTTLLTTASTTPRPVTTTTPRPVTTTTTTSSRTPTSSSCVANKWDQCGGLSWKGCTVCVAGTTCNVLNPYYSQCL